jgi:hypothetical protein
MAVRIYYTLLLISPILSSCAFLSPKFTHLGGPNLEPQAGSIDGFTNTQDNYLKAFARTAGLCPNSTFDKCPLPNDSPNLTKEEIAKCALPKDSLTKEEIAKCNNEWDLVVQGGMNYIDSECEQYIDSMFWWNRVRVTTRDQIALIGSSTAGILGITGVASAPIAITALGFGLATSSVDNIANSVLFKLDPSSVRIMLEKSRKIYRDEVLKAPYTTRYGAVQAIRGYLSLCLPATLEGQVNAAVSNTNFTAAANGRDQGKPTQNQAPILTQTK